MFDELFIDEKTGKLNIVGVLMLICLGVGLVIYFYKYIKSFFTKNN